VVEGPAAQPDGATIAARLVALLPASPATASATRKRVADDLASPQSRLVRLVFLALLASMAASALVANLAPRAGTPSPAPAPVPAAAPRL